MKPPFKKTRIDAATEPPRTHLPGPSKVFVGIGHIPQKIRKSGPFALSKVSEEYRMLTEEGRTVDCIAALFSASPLTVKRRMKLASVFPKLPALLREDAVTLVPLSVLVLADTAHARVSHGASAAAR